MLGLCLVWVKGKVVVVVTGNEVVVRHTCHNDSHGVMSLEAWPRLLPMSTWKVETLVNKTPHNVTKEEDST